MQAVDKVLQSVMPRIRQSAEWGVRSFKAPFGRLRLALPQDSVHSGLILCACAQLLNMRTRTVGLNEVRTTFSQEGDVSAPWFKRYLLESIAM